MSTVFWISNLINDTVLCFSNITLIEKIISLFKNPFIFFTTAKMLLMSFISQILLLLNPMSILVQFLTVNVMTSAQILSKILLRFSKYWNFNKISVKPQQGFCCFDKELSSIRSYSDQSCFHLALLHLTSPCLISPHLVTYSILKLLIVPHHVKMCLVLWQLIIQYSYLTHLNQLLFSFPISSYLVQPLSCLTSFHHHFIWFYSFAGAQPSKGRVIVMMLNYMLRNFVETSI